MGTPRAAATGVIGLQWGDEGKGKIIDLLAPDFAATVRFNGGANAGHSVVIDGVRHATHLVPSGIFHPATLAVIGNGCVVDGDQLVRELDALAGKGLDVSGLRLSDRAHLVLPYHKAEDALREDAMTGGQSGRAIGTTKRGIGPAYADKATRSTSIRVGDLLRPERLERRLRRVTQMKKSMFGALGAATPLDNEAFDADAILRNCAALADRLAPYITDTTYLIHDLLNEGKPVLIEGANATLLDVDHGTYPFVTSSNSSALGIAAGTGIPPRSIGDVIGVFKAYCTRVGAGPFPTELDNPLGARIRERGNEFGTTTGRPRRCGWLDLVALRYACMVNGVSRLAIMLLDVLAGFEALNLCTAYKTASGTTDRFTPDADALEGVTPVYEEMPGFGEELTGVTSRADLPANAVQYIDRIAEFVGVPIEIVSVGPDRVQTIMD